MKINKIAALVVAGTLVAGTASAQGVSSTNSSTNSSSQGSGLYIDFNLGYNFGLNSQVLGYNNTNSQAANGDYTSKNEVITGSFGKGMNIGGTVGYMFNANIGAELGINYLMGGTTSSEDINSSAIVGQEYSKTSTTDMSASMLQLNPSIVFSLGKEGFNPYAKFGMVIGTSGKITGEETLSGNEWDGSSNSVVAVNATKTHELSGSTAFGWSAAIGGTYAFNENMGLFGELNMINMGWSPSKGEITEYKEDGVDMLVGSTVRDRETDYVNETTWTSTPSTPDETKPNESLKNTYSFGSMGIKVGFRYNF